MTSSAIRIGVDVGGTNTDAVILDSGKSFDESRGILAFHKTPTTSRVTDGIETAVRSVLEQSLVRHTDISSLTIGTTHFINAIVEQDKRRLSRVAVLRVTKSFTKRTPPFCDFPDTLERIMNGYWAFVDGGLDVEGRPESDINERQVIEQCKEIQARQISSIVISGVFSPIDSKLRQEDRVRQIVKRELPNARITCSSEVSGLGFLERENASILNASILSFAKRTIRGFRKAMQRLDLRCPLYITQNDGTLIDADAAAQFPIRTFSSGPTNSMRGASYLGLRDSGDKRATSVIVADVGGTTTDVGVLLASGYPRQASAYTTVGGVTVNFSMPHVESIGLGGGSILHEGSGQITLGPESVGHNLTRESLVFGGKTVTATDIAVAARGSSVDIGNAGLVKDLRADTLTKAEAIIQKKLENIIDRMKTSPEPLPVLLVGGGAAICPPTISGATEIIRPPFYSVANAIGAAISKVGATIDIIRNTEGRSEEVIVEEAKSLAVEKVIAVGADPATVSIAEVETRPATYMANTVHIIIRAVGEMFPNQQISGLDPTDVSMDEDSDGDEEPSQKPPATSTQTLEAFDIDSYSPEIILNAQTGIPEWIVSEIDLEWLANGCYILGCAGGGSPTVEKLAIRDSIRSGNKHRIVDISALQDDARVYWGGFMGAPTVVVERLSNTEVLDATRELMDYLHEKDFDAAMSLEIGGANGLQPILLGAAFGKPAVDADWMGRAYPTLWQTTISVHCPGQLVPAVISSGDGKSIIMTRTTNDEIVDRALRASCTEMGSGVGLAPRPTTAAHVVKHGVLNTLSLAWRIGRCVARANLTNTVSSVAEQIIQEAGGPKTAKVLFRGKITAVERRLHKGHSYGEVTIQAALSSEIEQSSTSMMPAMANGGVLKIPFKNENVYAKHIDADGSEKYLITAPDLIVVLDAQSGRGLGVPEYRYGVMVVVLGVACSNLWTDNPKGIEIGGPRSMGLDVDYVPFGEYSPPKSVILEYQHKM